MLVGFGDLREPLAEMRPNEFATWIARGLQIDSSDDFFLRNASRNVAVLGDSAVGPRLSRSRDGAWQLPAIDKRCAG
jgi:hypothetical protein